jgi:UDP-2,3-diacylglucosamine hydrolase
MLLSFENALFISDIHLTTDRPDCIRAFFKFLDWIPESTHALFILGDFFEYWLGDDITTDLTEKVANALANLAEERHVQIFYLPGNRDFALGRRYCNQCHMQPIQEETLVQIADYKVCLSHGDIYCIDDKQYQRYRKVVRNPLILGLLKKLPKTYRLKIAEKLRNNSKQRFTDKPVYIDVTETAITDAFERCNSDVLIHGHTHMADIHYYTVNDKQKQRMVLGDWDKVGWYGKITAKVPPALVQFSILDSDFCH